MSRTRPKMLCPRCGRNLGGAAGGTCPDCGYVLIIKRAQYRGAIRYWNWLRARQRWEIVTGFGVLGLAVLGCWLLSFAPGWGIFTLTFMLGVVANVLGRKLINRQNKVG